MSLLAILCFVYVCSTISNLSQTRLSFMSSILAVLSATGLASALTASSTDASRSHTAATSKTGLAVSLVHFWVPSCGFCEMVSYSMPSASR